MARQLPYFIVDAFATGPFTGNPAGVMILDRALEPDEMLKLAAEINLSETAFAVPRTDTPGHYDLRWFTPFHEERLCGHATLATTHVLISEHGVAPPFTFHTRMSGTLSATQTESGDLELDFPASEPTEVTTGSEDRELCERLVGEAFKGKATVVNVARSNLDLLVELQMAEQANLADADVALEALSKVPTSRGVILTTRGSDSASMFHSRFFSPDDEMLEDPVTGSAHCTLGPYWASRIHGQSADVAGELKATQGGRRTGAIRVSWDGRRGEDGGRVKLKGKALVVAKGTFYLG